MKSHVKRYGILHLAIGLVHRRLQAHKWAWDFAAEEAHTQTQMHNNNNNSNRIRIHIQRKKRDPARHNVKANAS